ncbi:L-histidine Nalpha-methyltransferase / hercynylcysteine S-oxide synthase [Geosmithia morbida]|uniref:4-dimethylallyltryptophan N-methyltransferase n=1 Tax=Geosmithia morbida TaxID=1094350 RepID=A0A9P4YZZ1_9HYPO|nr:L-histidine Nalpha-methyltransferase / hercynylcysteine S-oxide synthase [Geosmithia morbida]KAF4125637.1 L-histidine Nalpha-methyltransferase / hercynylcysteine S-oxide synthase [Geosmithia morbida]
MSSFRIPDHGEVLDIGGSTMMATVEDSLRATIEAPYDPSAKPTLPDELLYDDVGLPIWNKIIFTPEFYQTHDEIAMFDQNGLEIVARTQPGVTMIDLGAGDTRKVQHLLAAFEESGTEATYLALDISRTSLECSIKYLKDQHSAKDSVVKCAALWGTFEDGLEWVQRIRGPRLFLSLGSVLCNDPWPEALSKVRSWAGILRPGDMLFVGMDAHLVPQDSDKVWRSYHSCDDLYREFWLNGFDHANRLAGETWFREEDWDFLAELEYPTRHRFFLRAKHGFRFGQTGRRVEKGEEIDWFDSHKYSQSDVEIMFEKANLSASNIWQAPNSEFRQYLVKLKGREDQRGDADSAVSGID